jgi:hypothetical protein
LEPFVKEEMNKITSEKKEIEKMYVKNKCLEPGTDGYCDGRTGQERDTEGLWRKERTFSSRRQGDLR